MNTEEFERILDVVVEQLGQEVRASKAHHAPDAFQRRVLDRMRPGMGWPQSIGRSTRLARGAFDLCACNLRRND